MIESMCVSCAVTAFGVFGKAALGVLMVDTLVISTRGSPSTTRVLSQVVYTSVILSCEAGVKILWYSTNSS